MKNHIKQTKTTTVCCVCGGHISGPWPATSQDLSHGYCAFHYQRAMQEIKSYLALMGPQPGAEVHAQAA